MPLSPKSNLLGSCGVPRVGKQFLHICCLLFPNQKSYKAKQYAMLLSDGFSKCLELFEIVSKRIYFDSVNPLTCFSSQAYTIKACRATGALRVASQHL